MIAIGGDETAGVPVWQVGHQFGHHPKADEKAVQRIIVQLVGAGEQFVKQGILALDVTDEQSLGELVLVFEMIEEAALGDADRGNHLLDRGGGEALIEHGSFRHVEDMLSGICALVRCLLHLPDFMRLLRQRDSQGAGVHGIEDQ